MPATLAALNILIFLLPGFLSQRIVEGLAVVAKPGDLTRVIDALVLSFVNYLFYSLLATIFRLKPLPIAFTSETQLKISWHDSLSMLVLFLVAVIVGMMISKSINEGWHYRILREGRLRFTRKTGRIDVWHDIFSDFRGRWIRVHLKNGAEIMGWPDYYSEDPAKRELFVAQAVVREPDGTIYEVPGPGVLLTEKAEVERIDIL